MTTTLIGALLVGLSLGLMGSGGSILTVPILTFLVGQPEKVAIAGSLAVVGFIALMGAIPYLYRGLVHWRSVLLFGVPGMIGSYGGAWTSKFISGEVQLGLFALTAVVAAFFMMRTPKLSTVNSPERAIWKIMLDGLLVGAFTGLVGVGGGFLIVPALVILGGLPMH
ncbi:MAG: sulfite exporter TauE/SafE family protein, partial [Candidatus Eisenbacteria bacterium]|nr:sulfite exporter TauE/SafE family protein [Candidatus Eisenbacteria bacterium]